MQDNRISGNNGYQKFILQARVVCTNFIPKKLNLWERKLRLLLSQSRAYFKCSPKFHEIWRAFGENFYKILKQIREICIQLQCIDFHPDSTQWHQL